MTTLRLPPKATVETEADGTIPVPVDSTVHIRSDTLTVDRIPPIRLWRDDGTAGRYLDGPTTIGDGSGTVHLELAASVTMHVRAPGPITIDTAANRTQLSLPITSRFELGIRNTDRLPGATVETTTQTDDLFRAISTFGVAHPTFSPERSYPILRRHPPAVAVRDRLRIPDRLDVPDTGIELELPPYLQSAIVAAPLASYFGARLVPGTAAELRIAGDPVIDLSDWDRLWQACSDLLNRALFLDCLVRRWPGPGDLHVTTELPWYEPSLLETLHDLPHPERLRRYLAMDPAGIDPHVPDWRPPAHIQPTVRAIEMLPHLVYRLATVRPHPNPDPNAADPRTMPDTPLPEPDESVTPSPHALGTHSAIGVNPTFPDAFRSSLLRHTPSDSRTVVLVCNHDEMTAEYEAALEQYESPHESIELVAYRNIPTVELASVLANGADHFHFIGHIEGSGLRCPDGHLDVAALPSARIGVFFLNACQSVHQGVRLVQSGAMGGIATRRKVRNSAAGSLGATVSSLLMAGFPIGEVIRLARMAHPIADRYVTLGDPWLDIGHPDRSLPHSIGIEPIADDRYEVTLRPTPTLRARQGHVSAHRLRGSSEYRLTPAESTVTVDVPELREMLARGRIPVQIGSELLWSDDCLRDLDRIERHR